MPELDIFKVFFQNGVGKLLNPALRRDIIFHCVGNTSET